MDWIGLDPQVDGLDWVSKNGPMSNCCPLVAESRLSERDRAPPTAVPGATAAEARPPRRWSALVPLCDGLVGQGRFVAGDVTVPGQQSSAILRLSCTLKQPYNIGLIALLSSASVSIKANTHSGKTYRYSVQM